MRRDLVRRSYDVIRWVEHRVTPSIHVPRGGYPPALVHTKGATDDGLVALTFDDGPDPELTPRVLDLLAEKEMHATFYVIGENARRHPEIVRRAFDEGHEIGNHTWSHRFLTTQRSASITEELRSTDEVIAEITGVSPASLRPPYGATTDALVAWSRHQFGYETVLWSLDSKDYTGASAEQITERVVGGVDSGSIVLFHDPLPATSDALSGVLDHLIGRGLRSVTLGELPTG